MRTIFAGTVAALLGITNANAQTNGNGAHIAASNETVVTHCFTLNDECSPPLLFKEIPSRERGLFECVIKAQFGITSEIVDDLILAPVQPVFKPYHEIFKAYMFGLQQPLDGDPSKPNTTLYVIEINAIPFAKGDSHGKKGTSANPIVYLYEVDPWARSFGFVSDRGPAVGARPYWYTDGHRRQGAEVDVNYYPTRLIEAATIEVNAHDITGNPGDLGHAAKFHLVDVAWRYHSVPHNALEAKGYNRELTGAELQALGLKIGYHDSAPIYDPKDHGPGTPTREKADKIMPCLKL